MEGVVVSLHIARAAGAPMLTLASAHLVLGRGIEGDRFYMVRETQSEGSNEANNE